MIDPLTSQRWLFRLLFVALAAALIYVRVLPLSTVPDRVPGPDIMLCLAFVWVQRRPDFLPPLLLVAVFLMADLLLMRPPGLWTALVLMGAEFLRNHHQGSSEVPFPAEWLLTAAVVVGLSLIYVLILNVTNTDHPSLALTVVQIAMTITFYPIVVVLSRIGFNLHRPTPGETDPHGVSR